MRPLASLAPANTWFAEGSDPTSLVTNGSAPAELVEAFVSGKSSTAPSEDIIVVTGSHLAVIDGMSSPLRREDSAGSGRAFALKAAEVIAALPASIEAREAIELISRAQAEISTDHAGPTGAVAAIISLERREVWRVGDIHIAVGDQHYPAQKDVDTALAWFRAAINAAQLATGIPLDQIVRNDPGLLAASELLRLQPALANADTPFGYGVLNGRPVPARYIEVRPIPDHLEVILASDGFLSPGFSLASTEDQLQIAIRADPAGLDQLRGFAKTMVPGFRAPDDRSYIRIRMTAHQLEKNP